MYVRVRVQDNLAPQVVGVVGDARQGIIMINISHEKRNKQTKRQIFKFTKFITS